MRRLVEAYYHLFFPKAEGSSFLQKLLFGIISLAAIAAIVILNVKNIIRYF